MEILIPTIKVIHIAVSVLLVLIILLQPSKSGDIGSMFGGGSSESVFGSSGAVPFLVKMTRLLGVVFVVTSLSLGYFSVKSIKGSVVKDIPIQTIDVPSPSEETPATYSDDERVSEGKTDGRRKAEEADSTPSIAPAGEPEGRSKPDSENETAQ